MEWLLLIIIGLLVMKVAREMDRNRNRRPRVLPRGTCFCGHAVTFHDDKGCHHLEKTWLTNKEGGEVAKMVRCGCQRFIDRTDPDPTGLLETGE